MGPEIRDEAWIRPELASIVLDQARRDLDQGVPRPRVAQTLERAARLHPLPEIAALLDRLGSDGGSLTSTDEAAQWAAVLHDDIVYPDLELRVPHDAVRPTWIETSARVGSSGRSAGGCPRASARCWMRRCVLVRSELRRFGGRDHVSAGGSLPSSFSARCSSVFATFATASRLPSLRAPALPTSTVGRRRS